MTVKGELEILASLFTARNVSEPYLTLKLEFEKVINHLVHANKSTVYLWLHALRG